VDNQDIIERIKHVRQETGLSMEKFSKALGIPSSGNISAWESGRALPGALALKAIHDVFGYSVDWILTGKSSLDPANSDKCISHNALRNELLRIFDTLTPDAQALLLGTVKTILHHSTNTPSTGATKKD
jgi:transcriptional regulator with XRE-family HTH domain